MSSAPILPKPSKDYLETIDTQAVLQELCVVKDRLLSEEVANCVAPIDSQKILQELEAEKKDLANVSLSLLSSSVLLGLTTFALSLLGLLLAWKPMTRLQKVTRLIALIKGILEEFEDLGVETLPLIQVPDVRPIDLFVRFPGKEFILFSIRSFGDATIVYNESKQTLYYKRGRKGSNKWKPDPLMELSEQAYWLKKNRRELFGSSKGARKPMPKVLVVWGNTKVDQHQDHLYSSLGNQKFLFLPREGGACYVIHQTQVIDFIRAHLAQRQSQ